MSLLAKILMKAKLRFGIYVVYDNNTKYVLSGNEPIRMLGYVISYFENEAKPKEGWVLYFSSKATRKHFAIGSEHFTKDGENITDLLLAELDEVDSRWRYIEGDKLELINYETNDKLKLENYDLKNFDAKKFVKDMQSGSMKEDWGDIMNKIFDR